MEEVLAGAVIAGLFGVLGGRNATTDSGGGNSDALARQTLSDESRALSEAILRAQSRVILLSPGDVADEAKTLVQCAATYRHARLDGVDDEEEQKAERAAIEARLGFICVARLILRTQR